MEEPGQSLFYGAADIGGTKIAVGLLGADGLVHASTEFPTRPEHGPADAHRRIAEWIESAEIELGRKAIAIGVGCTGPVDPATATIGDVELLPGWQGFALGRNLEQRFGVPVCLENDCDAAALGEALDGAGRGSPRFVYVSISTGVGAGIVLDGAIYRGVDGSHPELGHQALDPAGPPCYCGATGCWESLASGTAIASWYRKQSGAALSAAEVFSCAKSGDRLAAEALARFAKYTAIALGNLITFYAPDTIALGGGVMGGAAEILEPVIHAARGQARLVPAQRVQIRQASLGRRAGLVGAARAAHRLIQTSEGKSCTHA